MIEKERRHVIDTYLICLTISSLAFTLFFILKKIYFPAGIMIGFSLAFFCAIFTPRRYTVQLKIILYLFLSASIFFFTSYLGFHGGSLYSYIPLLLSLPLTFSINREKRQMFLIIVSMIMGLVVNILTDFKLFYNSLYKELQHDFLIANLIILLFYTILIFYALYRRQLLLANYDTLVTEKNKELKTILSNQASIVEIETVIDLAIKNDASFVNKLKLIYPEFFQKIITLCPNIIAGELELCAYLKLNFTTKEIAIYTKSTVRAIEAKKYRLRKKLNIDSNLDISIWMNKI